MRLGVMSRAVVSSLRPPRTSHMQRPACVALAVVVLALTCGAHAGGLFLPLSADAVPRSIETDPDARELHVRIARQELRAVRADVENAGAGRLLLNIADGVQLDVVMERTGPTKWGYSLSGRVAGGAGGFVTLVVHEEAVAGTIWTPDAAYELQHLGGGVHTLREVTNAIVQCSGTLPSSARPRISMDHGGPDDGSVVDILVVWTPAVQTGGRRVASKVPS